VLTNYLPALGPHEESPSDEANAQLSNDRFIHSKIYIAPLQENYSEALPTPARSKRTVL